MSDFVTGDLVRLFLTVTDIAGTKGDPGVLILTIKKPDAQILTITPTRDSIGEYHYDLNCDLPGLYIWRYSSTGNLQSAIESELIVAKSAI